MNIEERRKKLEELSRVYKVKIEDTKKILKNDSFEEVIIPFYDWVVKSKLMGSDLTNIQKRIHVYCDTIIIKLFGKKISELKLPNNLRNIDIPSRVATVVTLYNLRSIYDIDYMLIGTVYQLKSPKDMILLEKIILNYLDRMIKYIEYHNNIMECTQRHLIELWHRTEDITRILEQHIRCLGIPLYKSPIPLDKLDRIIEDIEIGIESYTLNVEYAQQLYEELKKVQSILTKAIAFLEKQQVK